jgi:hypothetical protein
VQIEVTRAVVGEFGDRIDGVRTAAYVARGSHLLDGSRSIEQHPIRKGTT